MQNKFDQSKETHLFKLNNLDKSKKGSVDVLMKPIINTINKKKDYFTTSSCSGRIIILKPADIKKDVEWLFVSHELVDYERIKPFIKQGLLFKLEGFILHVACRSVDSAIKLLNITKRLGLKRSGIVSVSDKYFLIEIISTEQLHVPLSESLTENYIKLIIDIANNKLKKTHEKIIKLKNSIEEKL